MKKISFVPFRSGEYSIDNYTFRAGYNEVPDEVVSTEAYAALVQSGAAQEIAEAPEMPEIPVDDSELLQETSKRKKV
jgi:hypothetical protein